MVLTTLQTLYAYFVEGSTIFVGKRKSFSKRVSRRLNLRESFMLHANASCR